MSINPIQTYQTQNPVTLNKLQSESVISDDSLASVDRSKSKKASENLAILVGSVAAQTQAGASMLPSAVQLRAPEGGMALQALAQQVGRLAGSRPEAAVNAGGPANTQATETFANITTPEYNDLMVELEAVMLSAAQANAELSGQFGMLAQTEAKDAANNEVSAAQSQMTGQIMGAVIGSTLAVGANAMTVSSLDREAKSIDKNLRPASGLESAAENGRREGARENNFEDLLSAPAAKQAGDFKLTDREVGLDSQKMRSRASVVQVAGQVVPGAIESGFNTEAADDNSNRDMANATGAVFKELVQEAAKQDDNDRSALQKAAQLLESLMEQTAAADGSIAGNMHV
ncbi:hypothetical protein VL15_38305 [Burkholderia cepacia]|uniref:Effector protein BipC n=1 Tax=Burkholderia cepacia TaxID=292 RepID=A0A0J5VWV4_BURCE|nr:IpaC/SipC family type III secretion system effector [Burkholderia cepacia]KML40116.1 hypothetical protein VL15_38305 [Burkholderia cepacia]